MRKIVYSAAVSLDGYVARPDGSVDYLAMTKDAQKLMRDFFARFDTILMGRKTAKTEGDEEAPQGPWKTYVFSRTRPPGERNGRTWVNESPAALVQELRKRRGKDIFLMGGGELARSFLQDDLVDELFIGVLPILLGEGIPSFPPTFPQRDFTLVKTKVFDGNSVALTYERVRTKTKRRVRPTIVR
jgi:dihydrofolate reductase